MNIFLAIMISHHGTLQKDMYYAYEQSGHPSFSPDGEHIVFDRYPDGKRIAAVMLADDNANESSVHIMARVFAPFKYDNDTRCDLHPRWSRDGKKICFDAVFEGSRGLYYVEGK